MNEHNDCPLVSGRIPPWKPANQRDLITMRQGRWKKFYFPLPNYNLLIFATILLMLGVMGISFCSYCTCKKVKLECIKCCNMLALLQVAVHTLTQILYPCCSFQKTDISKDEAKCVYRYISEFIQAERYFSSFEMSDFCSKKNEYKR